jgi:hypothetical protein
MDPNQEITEEAKVLIGGMPGHDHCARLRQHDTHCTVPLASRRRAA